MMNFYWTKKMVIYDYLLIKFGFCISFLIIIHGQPLDLELMVSIEDGFEAARGGIFRAIENFNSSSGIVNFSHDTVTLTDDLNKTQLCGDLIKLRKPLLIIEARRKPLMHRNTLKLMARNIRIPMLSASLDDYMMQIDEEWISLDPKESQFLISFQPLSIAMMRSILNVAPHFNIKNGVVFHEEYSDQPLRCLMKQNKNLNLTSIRIESRDIDDMTRVLKIKKKEKYTQFIIIGSSRTINLFLESFRRNDLFRKPYILVAISKDQGKIKCTLCKHGQLIIVKPSKSIYEYENVIPDQTSILLADQSIEFYFFYDLTRLLLSSIEKIVEKNQWKSLPITETCALRETNSNDNSFTPLLEYMNEESEEMFGRFGRFQFSSQANESHRPEFFYQEIAMRISQQQYRASGHSEKKLAEWENQLPVGSVLQTARLQDEDEEGGEGGGDEDEGIKVVLYLAPPFIMKRIVNGSSEPIYEGFLIDLFNEIKRILGDKMPAFELEETTAKSMGIVEQFEEEVDIEAPGLTGLLRDMQDNELKGFVLAPMTVTESRELIVDFSEPIFDQIGISVLMKKPERQSHTWRFITVLEKGVWASITGAYFFTSILLAIFDRYSPYSYRNKPEKYVDEEDKRIFTFKETLWFCFISLTPQGGGDAPKCISGRLVAAIWWLLGFVFTASYTANLAAFLTVSRLENHVDNMATLSKQYKIRYAPVENSAADAYFNEMAYIEDKYYEIWKNLSLDDDLSEDQRANLAVWEYPISDRYTKIKAQMVEAQKPKSIEEGVRKVRKSNSTDAFAFLSDSLDVEYFTFLYCDLFKAGDDFGYHPIALPIAKETNVNIKKLIDPIIRQLKDNGFIDNLRVKYWFTDKRRTNCPEHRILSNGLSLFNTYGMFTVLGIGMIFTLVVINLENWIITLWQRKEVKSQTVKHISVIPKS